MLGLCTALSMHPLVNSQDCADLQRLDAWRAGQHGRADLLVFEVASVQG